MSVQVWKIFDIFSNEDNKKREIKYVINKGRNKNIRNSPNYIPIFVLRNLHLQTWVGWIKIGIPKVLKLHKVEIEVPIKNVNSTLIIDLQL